MHTFSHFAKINRKMIYICDKNSFSEFLISVVVAARRVLTPGSYTMAPSSEDDDFDYGKKGKNFSFIVS